MVSLACDGDGKVLTGVFEDSIIKGAWLQPHSRNASRMSILQDL
jgi:hypothetical protein